MIDHGEREHVGDIGETPHRQRAVLQRRPARLRFEEHEIRPPLHNRGDLLREHPFNLILVLRLGWQRSDGAGDEHRPARLIGYLPRNLGAGMMNFLELLGQPEPREGQPIGAERIRGQHLGPGLTVIAVDLPDQARVGETQLVEATIRKDVVSIEFRPHGAVEDENPLLKSLLKGG